MYRVLCYGDSNTWGYNPVNGLRLSEKERWTGVLQKNLGDGFEVIEDGLNGRAVLGDSSSFSDALQYNSPFDVAVIFLGINDICFEKETRIEELSAGIDKMISLLRSSAAGPEPARPEVILMSALPVHEAQINDGLFELEAEKVIRYGDAIRKLAARRGCGFFDPGRIIQSSALDGIHIEAAEHKKLGLFAADYIRSFLKSSNLTMLK